MSVETRTIRVSATELGERLDEVLDRVAKGERITIERGGEDFAVIAPVLREAGTLSNVPLPPATKESVFDDEFVQNITEFRNAVNAARFTEWPE